MTRRLVPIAMLLLAAGAAPAGAEADRYVFERNGLRISPPVVSMHGDPETIRPGDLVEIHEVLIPVGPPGAYRYRIDWKALDTPLYRIDEDGSETLVAFAVKKSGSNPLGRIAGLSPEELAGLRGLRLATWHDDLSPILAKLDAERVTITLDEGVGGDGPGLGLPAGLSHLRLNGPSGAFLARALEGLPDLRSLTIRGYGRKVDASVLAGLADLASLSVTAKKLAHPEKLAGMASLRELRLTLYSGSIDLEAIAKIRGLRRLELSVLPVEDLSPLGGHPELAWITANMAGVKRLPSKPIPGLRGLDVMATPLTDEAVAAFAKAHPQCRIRHRLDGALHAALEGVTRIRVRSGGTCHRNPDEEKTLFEVTKPSEIRRILGGIRIQGPGPSCMCCGEPTFEFYRDGRLVVELGLHHGQAFRWPGGWPSDGELSKEGAAFVKELLARHGVEVR